MWHCNHYMSLCSQRNPGTDLTKINAKRDHRPKCKRQNYKLLDYKFQENLRPAFGDKFLDITQKAWSMKEYKNKLGFIKIKTSALQNTLLRESKSKPLN